MSKRRILCLVYVVLCLAGLTRVAAPRAAQAAESWTPTNSLNTSRTGHTATLLPNGRVLVAGGYNDDGYLASAEVYDPGTGQWTITGSLGTARYRHTATLLPDGRVLVAAGYGDSGYSASAEVYDPGMRQWSPTGSLSSARYAHTATLLGDGRVLVAGGIRRDDTLVSAEVYDPGTGQWTPAGSLNTGRSSHTATPLPDGQVIVAGGWGSSGVLVSAEVHDRGLGFDPDWRPSLATVTSPLLLGHRLQATGSGFRGYNFIEASGGATNNSATNYPMVQLRRVDSEDVQWLPPDPTAPFSATAFTSLTVTDFPQGPALVTVFVNGIPSQSQLIVICPAYEIFLPLVVGQAS